MKILVASDSHSSLSLMRRAIQRIKPDAVVHLGDRYDDGEAMQEEFRNINFCLIPGNWDKYSTFSIRPETLCCSVCGVKLFMTHGHNHHVERTLYSLLADARAAGAVAALYGHTHKADCHREEDGLWVLNPGTAGGYGSSVGLILTDSKQITDCRILRQPELEEFV